MRSKRLPLGAELNILAYRIDMHALGACGCLWFSPVLASLSWVLYRRCHFEIFWWISSAWGYKAGCPKRLWDLMAKRVQCRKASELCMKSWLRSVAFHSWLIVQWQRPGAAWRGHWTGAKRVNVTGHFFWIAARVGSCTNSQRAVIGIQDAVSCRQCPPFGTGRFSPRREQTWS